MHIWKSPPRSAKTAMLCKRCRQPLEARRTCHQAYLYCAACNEKLDIRDYIQEMDPALEAFLEAVNCDRV